MPIDKRAPLQSWALEFKIDTIANGYVITARANPSNNDPFGEKLATKKKAGPWYIRELEDATEMVAHMLSEIQTIERAEKFIEELGETQQKRD